MKHVMLDLETLGLTPGSAIRSIGACFFRPASTKDYADERIIGEMFYANITPESCLEAGLTQDANTVTWWARQSKAAQDAFADGQISLKDAIFAFNAWFERHGGKFIWSNGANFDQPLIEAAMRAVGMGPPWSYWDSRCVRTLLDMGRVDGRNYKGMFKGTAHNALDDAVHQARLCALAAGNLWPPDLSPEEALRKVMPGLPSDLRGGIQLELSKHELRTAGLPT